MSETALTIAEQAALRAEAAKSRREYVAGMWLAIKDEDPFVEHHYRRIFAMELLTHGSEDMHPRVGSFLGQTVVDRNAYTDKQRAYLVRLVESHLQIDTPKPEPKTKKNKEAGK